MNAKDRSAGGPSREASYSDVLDAPPHGVAEVLAGKLYMRPKPPPQHGRTQSILTSAIWNSFDVCGDAEGDWWILREPELRMGGDVVAPGIAGWRRERVPKLGNTYPSEAPDWVCELMHPSIRQVQLGIKQEICAREGAAYLWLVDPDQRTLEALELRCGRWSSLELLSGDAQVSSSPSGAAPFSLDLLWRCRKGTVRRQKDPRPSQGSPSKGAR